MWHWGKRNDSYENIDLWCWCDWILGELPNDDIYDFVLLTVRENQLYEALTELKNNKSNTIVTMINSLDSYNKWEDIVGNEYFSLFTLAIFSDYAGSYIWKQFWR